MAITEARKAELLAGAHTEDMEEALFLPRMHCLTCGHWGQGVKHGPCFALGADGQSPCWCSDEDAWVPDSVEGFRARYHLDD